MNTKLLLLALSAAAFSSCSTVYKSGQTPDDVYYSPIRVADERKEDDKKEDERRNTVQNNTAEDSRVRMVIRDRRWRDMNDDYDYDYSYRNSPYGYSNCQCNNYGYYYNPYYSSRPVYYPKVYTNTVLVNSTPRMVNLSSYKNYTQAVTNAKTGAVTTSKPTRQYNNSNSNNGGESRVGRAVRQILTPAQSNSTNNSNSNSNSSSNNNTRTYTPAPATNSSSSGSGGGSSSGSSSGSVARPGRG